MRISSLFVVVSLTLLSLASAPARVHAGPVEQLVQLAVHPSNPDVMALRYTNGGDGILYTEDGGATFKLLCLSAIDPMIRRSGPLVIAADGHTLMGVFDGLYEDLGNGCGWSALPTLAGVWISDMAPHPSDADVTFVATSIGGEGMTNGLVRRSGTGAYERFGVQEELLITRLRVTTTDAGLRFYESVIMGMIPGTVNGMPTEVPNYLIRVSDDDAETFESFPFGETNGAFRLVAVDPSNPDRIVAVVDREGMDDDLVVSSDRGETFENYVSLSNFGAIAFDDAGRVFIGESGVSTNPQASVGLWTAASLGEAPAKITDYPVLCLHYAIDSDTLFVCQRWSFGSADPDDGTFTEIVKFTGVQEFVACEGMDMAATCQAQLCRDYCGPGHFAQAPVCEAYDMPYCGPCVAAMEMGSDAECSSSTAGGGGDAPDAGTGTAGSTAGAAAGTSAGADGEAGSGQAGGGSGTGGDDDGDDDGGGCTVRTAGSARGGAAASLMLLALIPLVRRRRRV